MMRNKLLLGDCLERMSEIEDGSIDMVLCDLPYGITQNKWDCELDLELLWEHYLRVGKQNCIFALHASQPFTAKLVCSQLKLWKYEWVWEKSKATGHLNAAKRPMVAHESIQIFSQTTPRYFPQKSDGKPYVGNGGQSKKDNYGDFKAVRYGSSDGSRYPRSVCFFPTEGKPIHPTQKPLLLAEYLIKTYTKENEVVLDNCCGSGTTLLAAKNLKRRYIGIEKERPYYEVAKGRLGLKTKKSS